MIQDQCLHCRHYNNDRVECSKLETQPILNGCSCEYYQKNGINLSKGDDTVVSEGAKIFPIETPQSESNPNPANQKKGIFKHPFSFKGRIRRLEYGISYLIRIAYLTPMELMSEDNISENFALIWLMLLIPFYWFFIAQNTKRCHDLGHSGWWQLIPFYMIWMLFQEGETGQNRYGDNPKE